MGIVAALFFLAAIVLFSLASFSLVTEPRYSRTICFGLACLSGALFIILGIPLLGK